MKQLKLISVRKVLALAVLGAVAMIGAGVALATPATPGGLAITPIDRGTLGPHFKINLRDSSKPGDVVLTKFVLAPGAQSGWHFHPGPAVVTVKSGVLTLDHEDCSSATFNADQVAVEPIEHVHRVRNLGTIEPLEFWVMFLDVPVGSNPRIEAETDPRWVEPAC